MSRACSVSWCILVPREGETTCAIHLRYPVHHSRERRDEWEARVAQIQPALALLSSPVATAADASPVALLAPLYPVALLAPLSAGGSAVSDSSPAPVTFTAQEAARLVAEAIVMATKPDALLLPTRDHLRALVAHATRAELDRTELRNLVIALIEDQGQHQLMVPKDVLARVAVAHVGLAMEDVDGLPQMRRYRLLRPVATNGRVN